MNESDQFKVGSAVGWQEGDNRMFGTVAEIYTEPISEEIAGVVVTSDASPDNPAYLLSMSGNQRTLKRRSELRAAD
ncbi:MAG: DUF2945 domain-containing protein [Verrucomicrobiales bacterium]